VHGITTRDTKKKNCVQQVIEKEPKLRAVDIGVRHKNTTRKLLARQRNDTQWF
jgi:hypothetical protein